MRNLNEYPLTADEVLGILARIGVDIKQEGGFGDMRPYALEKVAQFLTIHTKEFEEFIAGSGN